MANTAIKGLNIDAIRELNKIYVYSVKRTTHDIKTNDYDVVTRNEDNMEKVFTAYLTSPLGSFNSQLQTDSLTQSIGDFIKQSKIVSTLGETAIGGIIKGFEQGGKYNALGNFLGTSTELANQLNYNFNYRFTGINDFTHSFQCELVVKDDFFDDVLNPLWSLLEYVLPDETSQLNESDVYTKGKSWAQEIYTDAKGYVNEKASSFIESDTLNWFWDKIEALGGTADNMMGGLSFMKKPKQLQAGNLFTRIVIGNYIVIDNVMIDSVGFNIPYLFYEGGLFDKVAITLNVKGNRKMSLKTYDWIRTLKESKDTVGESTTWKRSKQDTLNYLYNKDNDTNVKVFEEKMKRKEQNQ